MTTTNTQHTPAPWSTIDSFSRHADVNSEMMHFRTRIECIAPFRENENSDRPNELVQYQTLCHVYGRTVEEMKANAEFIASAPELLKENEQLKGENKTLERQAEKRISELCNKISGLELRNTELLEALIGAKEELTFLFAQDQNTRFWSEQAESRFSKVREAIAKAEGK